MKHVYRAIIFLVFFVGSVFIFSGNIKESQGAGAIKSVEQASPAFPIMTVRTQGYDMNVLHGYNSNLKASINRESMTPVGIDKSFQLLIDDTETTVRKLKYELRRVNDNGLIDSGEISALEETKEGKVATVTLDSGVEQGKEYAFKITAVTKEGKKIHYFTHVKYYGSDSFLKEKMDFVLEFHDNTFKKSKLDAIAAYLETASNVANDDYAHVDITSSREMIGWGSLEPEVVSEVVPTVKEFNIETGAICLEYFVKIQSGEGTELCQVKEFYRVRYSGGRMYLLKFERDMQTLYDVDTTSVKQSECKLGITDPETVQVKYSDDENRMAFVSAGELWEYALSENTVYRVFSFRGADEDYIRGAYNQHNVRIMNLDNDGNMDFMVYGYMNAGDYEGCVGIVWYKYYAAEQRIEEQVFIPMETTYQMLKENLDPFSYVSDGGVFFFAVDHTIYSYDAVSKQLKTIADNVQEQNYCYVEDAGVLAWQSDSNDTRSQKIVLMDLETKKEISLETDETERILLIGSIDENIVYGVVRAKDISESADGSQFTPMYKVCIVDKTGRLLKEYQEKKIYVESATVKENVVQLNRVKKTGDSYRTIKSDSIQNQQNTQEQELGLSIRVTEQNLKEYYLKLQSGFVMAEVPSLSDIKNTFLTESSIVRLHEENTAISRYYVYAEGVIIGAYSSPAKAIAEAEDAMGVVVNGQNQIVYERAGKYTNNAIGSVEIVSTGNGVNSKGACLASVLR